MLPPIFIVVLGIESESLVGMVGSYPLICNVSFFLLVNVIVIFAVPTALIVNNPVELTETIFGLEDLKDLAVLPFSFS